MAGDPAGTFPSGRSALGGHQAIRPAMSSTGEVGRMNLSRNARFEPFRRKYPVNGHGDARCIIDVPNRADRKSALMQGPRSFVLRRPACAHGVNTGPQRPRRQSRSSEKRSRARAWVRAQRRKEVRDTLSLMNARARRSQFHTRASSRDAGLSAPSMSYAEPVQSGNRWRHNIVPRRVFQRPRWSLFGRGRGDGNERGSCGGRGERG